MRDRVRVVALVPWLYVWFRGSFGGGLLSHAYVGSAEWLPDCCAMGGTAEWLLGPFCDNTSKKTAGLSVLVGSLFAHQPNVYFGLFV